MSCARKINFQKDENEIIDGPTCEDCGAILTCPSCFIKAEKRKKGEKEFNDLIDQGPESFMATLPTKFTVTEPYVWLPVTFELIENNDEYFCYKVSREHNKSSIKAHDILYYWRTSSSSQRNINKRLMVDKDCRWVTSYLMDKIKPKVYSNYIYEILDELRINHREKF